MLKRVNIGLSFVFLFIFSSLVFSLTSFHSVYAANRDELCSGANMDITGDTKECNEPGSKKTAGEELETTIATVVNLLSAVVGVAAVIMVIVGGFRYVTSNGDSGAVGSAKNTIIYALVGLAVVALAQLIVRFVAGSLGS